MVAEGSHHVDTITTTMSVAEQLASPQVAELKDHVSELIRQLQQVTEERNRYEIALRDHEEQQSRRRRRNICDQNGCQRYEERIVELHSVIAELSRKLQVTENDVIEEEDDSDGVGGGVGGGEDRLCPTDQDLDSLAFERDLEEKCLFAKVNGSHQNIPEECEEGSDEDGSDVNEEDADYFDMDDMGKPDLSYKIELFDEVHSELLEAQKQNQDLKDSLLVKDSELASSEEVISELRREQESLKRQLDDLQNTVEYQEAKMDSQQNGVVGSQVVSSPSSRQNGHRRSVRKTKKSVVDRTACSPGAPLPPLRSSSCHSSKAVDTPPCSNCHETRLELDKMSARCDHLASQNTLLNLSLEESKTTTDKMTVLVGKYEANISASQLAVGYGDSIIEAYDVLVALIEAASEKSSRRRLAAENVAKHLLLSRPPPETSAAGVAGKPRLDSGLSGVSNALDTTWDTEYSSGYSQTTASSSSTTSSSPGAENPSKPNHQEIKVREHINQLKNVKATVQRSVVELEPYTPGSPVATTAAATPGSVAAHQAPLEEAVSKQELMGMREECADLRAKLYLSEKESSALHMNLEDRYSVENILRTHIEHLQDQLDKFTRGEEGLSSLSREDKLRQRVDTLLNTLDRVTRNGESRHKQADDLIADLKQANSTLSEALDRCKKKYQSRIKKMEQKYGCCSKGSTTAPSSNQNSIKSKA